MRRPYETAKPLDASGVPDPSLFFREGIPIKLGKYREVWRLNGFVLKLTKAPGITRKLKLSFIPGRKEREIKNSLRIAEAGFKTPKPVLWGSHKKGCVTVSSFAIFQFVEGRHPKEDDLEDIAILLGRMNKSGIFPLDPHPENFIISKDGIYLLDTYYTTFQPYIGRFFAAKALSKLLLSLFLNCQKEKLVRSLEGYNAASGRYISLEELVPIMIKLAKNKTKKAGKISLRDKKSIQQITGKEEILKRSSKSKTVRIGNVVMKTSIPVFLRKTRGEKAWMGLHMLKRHNIPSPEPLALSVEGTLKRKSTIYMSFVEGVDVESFIKVMWGRSSPGGKMLMAKKLARLVGSLYVRSILHTDLKGRNILWDGERFILLDPEAIRCKKVTRRDVLKNLIQLEKSVVRKIPFSYRYAFLKNLSCFLIVLGLIRDEKSGIRELVKGVKKALTIEGD